MSVVRFGISLDASLLERFDSVTKRKGYTNRSEAIRDLIRGSLVNEEWEHGSARTVGTITLVYDHHTRELADTLTDLQHRFHKAILSSTHVHLDGHNCIEVVIVRGRARDLKEVADRLIGTRGVKHGRFTATTSGEGLK
ncbi:MAG: nickel-responsive transcriptional regulator NikR [Actinomycetota bacterium]|nr:nickel-responsive transcriptional regulator NikR [Actinomycetota bacterium]